MSDFTSSPSPMSLLCIWIVCTLAQQAACQEVAFVLRATQPYDQTRQQIRCNLDAERTIRQQNQLVDTSKQSLLRTQERVLTILAIEGGTPSHAKLEYGDSSTQMRGENSQEVEATQPIAGNTYYVRRTNGSLRISDDKGRPVTEEEDKILQLQLETFGKANPLAKFLNGKRIAIGQSIEVPDEVASELLGLTGNKGKTDKLTIRLVASKQLERENCAVFETLLRTSSEESSMSLLMKGEIIIETRTCRTRSIRLHGPVAITETRGPAVGRFMVSTNGTLQVAVSNSFGTDRVGAARTATRR